MSDPGRYLQCIRKLRDLAGKGCWEAQVCDLRKGIIYKVMPNMVKMCQTLWSFLPPSSLWPRCAALGIHWVWSLKPAPTWCHSSSVAQTQTLVASLRAFWDGASMTRWGRDGQELQHNITGIITVCGGWSYFEWWLTALIILAFFYEITNSHENQCRDMFL